MAISLIRGRTLITSRRMGTLNIGSFEVVVHHTPGHSPGHVVYAIPQEKVIFVGDVIFADSIGRTDATGGDMDRVAQQHPENDPKLPGCNTPSPGSRTGDHGRL